MAGGGRGWHVGGAKSYYGEKDWSSIKHSILSDLDLLCCDVGGEGVWGGGGGICCIDI